MTQASPPIDHRRSVTDNHAVIEVVDGRSVVTSDRGSAPLKLLCPARRGPAAWVYTSSFGGGLVAGDTIDLSMRVGPQAQAVLTTQASTKVYHARRGGPAKQVLRAKVDTEGLLVVWPDFITLFEDAAYEQEQTFALGKGASLVLLEVMTCGRLAMGERWAFDRYASRNTVEIKGVPAVIDSLVLDRQTAELTHPLRAGRFNAMATLHLIGPRITEHADALATQWRNTELPGKDTNLMLAVSRTDHGALLRGAATDTETLLAAIYQSITPLFDDLGFCPWERKW